MTPIHNPHLLLLKGPHPDFWPKFWPDFWPDFWPGFWPGFLDPKIQCTGLLGRRNTVLQFYWARKFTKNPRNPFLSFFLNASFLDTSSFFLKQGWNQWIFGAWRLKIWSGETRWEIFGNFFDQIFGQVFDQGFWDPKIQCTGLLGRRNTVLQVYRDEKF